MEIERARGEKQRSFLIARETATRVAASRCLLNTRGIRETWPEQLLLFFCFFLVEVLRKLVDFPRL